MICSIQQRCIVYFIPLKLYTGAKHVYDFEGNACPEGPQTRQTSREVPLPVLLCLYDVIIIFPSPSITGTGTMTGGKQPSSNHSPNGHKMIIRFPFTFDRSIGFDVSTCCKFEPNSGGPTYLMTVCSFILNPL